MVADEQTRQRVYARLRDSLGEEVATTLMAGVPPFSWAEVATKADLASLRDDLRGEMQILGGELRGEMGDLRVELRGEIGELRGEIGELRGEMQILAGELRGEIGELRGEIQILAGELRGEMGELRGEMGEQRGEMGRMEARLSLGMATTMTTMTRHYLATTVGAVLTTGVLAFAAAGLT